MSEGFGLLGVLQKLICYSFTWNFIPGYGDHDSLKDPLYSGHTLLYFHGKIKLALVNRISFSGGHHNFFLCFSITKHGKLKVFAQQSLFIYLLRQGLAM